MLMLLLAAGIALVMAALLFGTKGPTRKASGRRLNAVKSRHATAAATEVTLRRITAQRDGKLDSRLHPLLPDPDLLRHRIAMTGKSWTLNQYVAISAGLTVAVWLLLALRGAPLLLTLFCGLFAGIGLPWMMIGRMAGKRVLRFTAHFPDAIELLVRGLRSGLPVSETIGVVGNELPDPVGTEFRAVADKMKIGRTMEAALQETADRIATPEIQFFVITLAIQRETGGNLAETLSNLSDVLRKRMQMKLKIRAMSSESKASAYIIGCLPFVVFGLISYINPAYMGTFFTDHRLVMAAIGGGIWMSLGVFIMAKMINFEI